MPTATQALLQDDIFQLLGLSDLSPEKKAKMLEKIAELILKRICIRVMDELVTDEDKKQAEKIFTTGTDDQKLGFIQSKMELMKIMEEEVVRVKQDIVDDVKKAGFIQ